VIRVSSPPVKETPHQINQVLRRRWKGRYRDVMRRLVNLNKATASCFTSSSLHCIKEIQKRARHCINSHSLMVQSINSIINACKYLIRMEKRFAFTFSNSNLAMTYWWNGTGIQTYWQIFRGNQQKMIVIFMIIIYNLDTRDDFDEINYSLKFNPPSSTEFANVYNEKYISLI
jgi:hypothetical protein